MLSRIGSVGPVLLVVAIGVAYALAQIIPQSVHLAVATGAGMFVVVAAAMIVVTNRKSFMAIAVQWRAGIPPVFPGVGVGKNSLVGIVMISLGVILGAALLPPTITNLVTAAATTGITSSASTIVDVGQLIGAIALTLAPSLSGMFVLFQDVKAS